MELFAAHKQWSTRPADERFDSLQSLHDATKGYAATAREREGVPVSSLRVENVDGDVQLLGKGDVPARLTHWSFGQLAARVSAPASYLRTLPATLAAQNINHGLAKRAADPDQASTVNLLFHANGSLLLRALTSDRYERIWNHEITDRLLDLQSQGWEPARPDIRVQDDRLPLYASDHDMFAFIRHTDRVVKESGSAGLQRGLIVENSEVGASKLRLQRFLYREMCGNHIIWGASDVTEIALRHVGNIREKLTGWDASITKYLDSSVSDDEAQIARAQSKRIAATKIEVLDLLFGRKLGLTRKALDSGYDMAEVSGQDGDPRSVWGMVQGLTRYSQTVPYADERTTIDRAAGKLVSLVDSF